MGRSNSRNMLLLFGSVPGVYYKFFFGDVLQLKMPVQLSR